jgi:hypothetical protein
MRVFNQWSRRPGPIAGILKTHADMWIIQRDALFRSVL